MRIAYIIIVLVIITVLIPYRCEIYSHKSFRWINISNSIFAYQRIWYKNDLILKTDNPKVRVDISLRENGIIDAEIAVDNGYPGSFWYKYYSIADQKWMNNLYGEYIQNVGCTQFLDINYLNESEQDRLIFEAMLNKFDSIYTKSKESQIIKHSVLEL